MSKEEQSDSLYHILLKRNQANADFIRRHRRRMQQFQKTKSLYPTLGSPVQIGSITQPILSEALPQPLPWPQQPNTPKQLRVCPSASSMDPKCSEMRFPSIKHSQVPIAIDKMAKNQVCLPYNYPIGRKNNLSIKMEVSVCFGDGEPKGQKLYQVYDGNKGSITKNRTQQSLEKQLSLNQKQAQVSIEDSGISGKPGNIRRLNGSFVRHNIKELISKALSTQKTENKTCLSPQFEIISAMPANSSPNKALLKMQDLVFSTIRPSKEKSKIKSKQNSSLLTTYKTYKHSATKNYDIHDSLADSIANSQSSSCKNIGNFPSISLSALSCANTYVQKSTNIAKPKRKTLEERKVNLTEITSLRPPELDIRNTKNFFVPFQQQFCHLKMTKQADLKENRCLNGNKSIREQNCLELCD